MTNVYLVPQHLDRRTPVGFFTMPEWIALIALAFVALAWLKLLTPFANMQVNIVIAGLILSPVVAKAYFRGAFDLGLTHRVHGYARMAVAPRHRDPGEGRQVSGYVVVGEPTKRASRRKRGGRRGTR